MFRKILIYSLIPLALAGTFASLSASLAACAGQSDAIPTSTSAPTKTVTPTFTPTLDFLQLDRIPGLDPLTFTGQGETVNGEKFSLPQDVFSEARSRHLAPIEAEGGIASGCANNSCTVMLTDVLVSGAQLQQPTDGKVIYGFDGQTGSEALFRFSGLPEGVRATAFVAQDGNPWGFKPGTVVVWFWQGGGKGPTQVLNLDNPLQIIADAPNSISLTAIDNGLRITRIGPDGTVIDEQRVAFLPPLPSELSQLLADKQDVIVITNGQVLVGGQAWFELNSAGEWRKTDWKLLADAPNQNFWRERYRTEKGNLRQDIWPVLTGKNLEVIKEINGQPVVIKGRLGVIPNPYQQGEILKVLIPYRYEWGDGLFSEEGIMENNVEKNVDYFLQLAAGEQLFVFAAIDSVKRPAECTFGTKCGWSFDIADLSADFFLNGITPDGPVIVSPVMIRLNYKQ
ncbi:MAG: hypothetical protein L6300_01230 [Syntrophaceae bacterium]|nr:hypothetical protein [Syntrophaceae bacterium]